MIYASAGDPHRIVAARVGITEDSPRGPGHSLAQLAPGSTSDKVMQETDQALAIGSKSIDLTLVHFAD
jgi:hypothetical protein